MTTLQKFYALDTGVANNAFSGVWMLTRVLKQAGWGYVASSDGSSKETAGVAANDKWGGGATPTSDTYPGTFTNSGGVAGPWWVARGPQIVKIPVTVAASGTFVRGEQVSQATSAATGELLGYVFDATNHGWLIVSPRTGTFDGTHLLTGNISAATVTAAGTVKVYTQEVVFWKSTTDAQTGNIYWVVADASAESSKLFSTLSTSAGCTGAVAPGGGGTGNGFPSVAIAILGSGGLGSAPQNWVNATATSHCLLSAVNPTPATGVSADGTFWALFGTASSSSVGALWGLFRLDDGEQGDACPFEWFFPTLVDPSAFSRTASANAISSASWTQFLSTSGGANSWVGYIARGIGTAGSQPDVVSYHLSSYPAVRTSYGPQFMNPASLFVVQNHPATTKPMAVDTVALFNDVTGQQQGKGRARWMRYASSGTLYDTTDAKTWVCWFANNTNVNPSIYVGPWDGITTPAP